MLYIEHRTHSKSISTELRGDEHFLMICLEVTLQSHFLFFSRILVVMASTTVGYMYASLKTSIIACSRTTLSGV